jgi:membrane protein
MIGGIMKDKKFSKMDLLIHLIVKVKNDDIFALASQLAYYLMLAFFPFLIFVITLIGFINLNESDVLDGLSSLLPISVFELIESTIIEIIGSQNTGLLGISILLTIWTASSGFRAVIKGINKAYNIEDDRNYFKRTTRSFLGTIALAFAVFSALALLVFGNLIENNLIRILPFAEIAGVIWDVLRNGIIIIALILVFATIYKYAPTKKIKWKEVLPGAVFSALGWLILSMGFSFYINNYNNYSRVYGSLAAVFILMIWLFLTSMIFIFGVEINSVLAKNKK